MILISENENKPHTGSTVTTPVVASQSKDLTSPRSDTRIVTTPSSTVAAT